MNSRLTPKVVTRLAARIAGGLTLIGVLLGVSGTAATSMSMSACGESGACTNLRNDTYAQLEVWQACDPAGPADQCLPEAGNPKDCTGVLACEFAINPKFRAEAEQRVLSIGEASQGCYLCAVPQCISITYAICEPISRRCIGVSSVTDGGEILLGNPSGGDSGTNPVEDSGGSAPLDSGDGATASPTG